MRNNPASLGLRTRMSVGYGYSELATGLADDVWIQHLGAAYGKGALGVGLLWSRLDQGEQVATDETGSIVDTFDAAQRSLKLGVGWSVLESLAPEVDPRYTQLSIGIAANRIDDEAAPAWAALEGENHDGSGLAVNLGLLLRKRVEVGDGPAGRRPSFGFRIAAVVDDLLESEIEFTDSQKNPFQRFSHAGFAIEGELLHTDPFGPLLSFMAMVERSDSRIPDDETQIDRFAFEVVVANTASFRLGQVEDPEGGITSSTYGVGLGLEWIDLPVQARIDYANRPQALGLPRIDVFSIMVTRPFD